jgi:hypothetical protein
MTLIQVSSWRNRTGKIGTFVCILFFLAILDALSARLREPSNHFSGLPGSRIAVNGPLAEQATDLRELIYASSSRKIQLVFETTQTGFWLGGNLWNGTLNINPGIQPGTYTVEVRSKKTVQGKPASLFQIEVYKDLKQLQANSRSFSVRVLGINAWQVAIFFFPLVLLAFGGVFYLSQQREKLLSEQGKAEVYRTRAEGKEEEIFFGLGSQQGLKPGTQLILFNPQGLEVGPICAAEVFETHSTARVDPGWKVHPGFMVSQL